MSKISNNTMAAIFGLVVSILIVFCGVATYVKYHNIGVTYEQRIKAVYDDNRVVLNSYTTKVQEVAQVPDIYKNDLKEIVEGTFQGRYGENGSKAVFQMIQEQNLSLDPSMYRQIQQVMESGRNEFKTSQKQLVDVTNNYEASLNYAWSGLWLKITGFPKINLADYKVIVTDDVNNKFVSGKDEVIKLGGKDGE